MRLPKGQVPDADDAVTHQKSSHPAVLHVSDRLGVVGEGGGTLGLGELPDLHVLSPDEVARCDPCGWK